MLTLSDQYSCTYTLIEGLEGAMQCWGDCDITNSANTNKKLYNLSLIINTLLAPIMFIYTCTHTQSIRHLWFCKWHIYLHNKN